MLHLLELLDIIPPRIVGGDKYTWTCYGDNARYLDMEQNVDVIFDEETQEIYEISIRGDDEEGSAGTVWRSTKYEPGYLDEMKSRRNLDDEEVNAKKSNISNISFSLR